MIALRPQGGSVQRRRDIRYQGPTFTINGAETAGQRGSSSSCSSQPEPVDMQMRISISISMRISAVLGSMQTVQLRAFVIMTSASEVERQLRAKPLKMTRPGRVGSRKSDPRPTLGKSLETSEREGVCPTRNRSQAAPLQSRVMSLPFHPRTECNCTNSDTSPTPTAI